MRARLRLMAPVFALLILATSISPTAASGPYTWYPRYRNRLPSDVEYVGGRRLEPSVVPRQS